MEPENFRQLLLEPGTSLGLIGEYGGASEWSGNIMVYGTLKSYIIVERHHNIDKPNNESVWDTAIIISLPEPLRAVGLDNEEYSGQELLLIQRQPDFAWDRNDPDVHVFGIRNNQLLGEVPLSRNTWRPQTVWLAGAAIMSVEDALNPSPLSNVVRKNNP